MKTETCSRNMLHAEKTVTSGKVQTYEYNKIEQKIPVRKRIQGFLDSALTIKKDENLKLLIKNQSF